MHKCIMVLGALIVISSIAAAQGDYRLNIDTILKNDKRVDDTVKCLLGQGRCDPQGAHLKMIISPALTTDCLKCSQVERDTSSKFLAHLTAHRISSLDSLVAKYDPNGLYFARIKSSLPKN